MSEYESEFDLEIEERRVRRRLAREPVKPLPRLWKTEPDPSDEDGLGSADGDSCQEIIQGQRCGAHPSHQANQSAAGGQAEEDEGERICRLREMNSDKKKVLLEETPRSTPMSRADGLGF